MVAWSSAIACVRLRLDGLFRYKFNGRIRLAMYFAEMCADARALASRGLKAPINDLGRGDERGGMVFDGGVEERDRVCAERL